MIKLTEQELQVCYILSRVFNYYTSYNDILSDIEHNKLLCFAFGFVKYPFKEQKEILQKDSSIHRYDYFEKDLLMWWIVSFILAILIGVLLKS